MRFPYDPAAASIYHGGLGGRRRIQFIVPAYQRVYSWNPQQCRQLWQDIERAGRTKTARFIGTLLYSNEPERTPGIARWGIIDGQQRTVTVSLILVAFEKYLRKTGKRIMPRGFGRMIRNLRNATTLKPGPATFSRNEKRAAVRKDRRSSFYVAGFPATPLYLLSSPAPTQA